MSGGRMRILPEPERLPSRGRKLRIPCYGNAGYNVTACAGLHSLHEEFYERLSGVGEPQAQDSYRSVP